MNKNLKFLLPGAQGNLGSEINKELKTTPFFQVIPWSIKTGNLTQKRILEEKILDMSGKLQYQMHNFFKKFNHINDLTRKPDILMNIAFSNSISNLYFNCYH